jgi:hypothetical protein
MTSNWSIIECDFLSRLDEEIAEGRAHVAEEHRRHMRLERASIVCAASVMLLFALSAGAPEPVRQAMLYAACVLSVIAATLDRLHRLHDHLGWTEAELRRVERLERAKRLYLTRAANVHLNREARLAALIVTVDRLRGERVSPRRRLVVPLAPSS